MDTGRLNQRHVPDFGFGRILIASVFLLFGLFALTADGQEEYDFSRFGNEVRENTSYASQKAAERIRTAVEYAVPFTRGSARITIYIAENQETEPSLRYIRSPREVRVIVPEDALLWAENPEYLHKITAWMILARIGEPPSNAPLIQNHWIVRAIARKTMGEAEKISMPMAEYAPCSRTLTANGYLPELRMVFSSVADERSSVLSRMSDEYAELLYNYCRSCGLIQNRIVQKIITYTIKNPDAKQFPLFLSAGISAGLNKIFSTK